MWKKLATNTGIQLVGRAISILIGLATTAWLTRNLGLEGYGRYTLLVALFVLLDNLADFGSRMVGTKEIGKTEAGERWKKWSELLVWRSQWSMLVALTGVVWVILAGGFEGFRGVAAGSMIMVGLTSLAGSLEAGWQVGLKMERKVAVEVLMSVLTLGGFYLLDGGTGLAGVVAVLIGARVISLGWGWLKLRGEMSFRQPRWSREKFKWWLKRAAPMGWYMLIFAGYDRVVDTMMIEHWWGKQEVAWYGLGYKIYGNLVLPAYYLVNSALPIWASKNITKNWEQKFFKIVMGAGTGVAVSTFVLAPVGVAILGGDQYSPTIGVLRWLSVALIASFHNHYVGFKYLSMDREKVILKTGLATLVINIGLNWILIPRYGIMGAAGATAATEMMSGLMLRLQRK